MKKAFAPWLAALLAALFVLAGCAQPHSWVFSGIEIVSGPDKTEYMAGETFDPAGMQVMAVYSDENSDAENRIDVTAAVTAPSAPLEEGQTEVVVSYTDNGVTKSASVAVTVGAFVAPDYGTLTVADVYLYNSCPSASVMAVFSIPAQAEEISYAFVSDLFTIENGVASLAGSSVSAPAQVEVTARTQHHTATFTVHMAASFTGYDGQAAMRERTMEVRTAAGLYRQGGVIFCGDSFFDPAFWTDFENDYAGRNAALIGIGGSRADEWPVFIERLLYPFAPSAVVLNLGTNDLGRSEGAQTAVSELQALFEEIHKALPDAEICWYTLAPRGDTTALDASIPAVNEGIAEWAQGKEWFTLLDAYSEFTDENGDVDWSMLKGDKLHPQLATYDSVYMALLQNAGIEPGLM